MCGGGGYGSVWGGGVGNVDDGVWRGGRDGVWLHGALMSRKWLCCTFTYSKMDLLCIVMLSRIL